MLRLPFPLGDGMNVDIKNSLGYMGEVVKSGFLHRLRHRDGKDIAFTIRMATKL